jgi:hypothetical protein
MNYFAILQLILQFIHTYFFKLSKNMGYTIHSKSEIKNTFKTHSKHIQKFQKYFTIILINFKKLKKLIFECTILLTPIFY